MAVNFGGRWKESRAENKAAMMEAMNVPAEIRTKVASIKGTLEITHDGDNICTKTLGEDGTVQSENSAKIGIPFTPKIPAGVPWPVGELICTWVDDGKVLRTKSTTEDAKVPVYDLKIENEELVSVQTLGKVTATIYYAKV